MPIRPGKPSRADRARWIKEHDELVDQVLVALAQTGLCKVWPQPTGAAFRGSTMIRYGVIGSADISGIMIGSGKRLEVEVKTRSALQSVEQRSFEQMIKSSGGYYFVARSVELVLMWLKLVSNGQSV